MALISSFGKDRPTVAFQSLANYNSFRAFGTGLDRRIQNFWMRIYEDGTGNITLPVRLSHASDSNVTINWSYSGSAVSGTHFNDILSSQSTTVRAGQRDFALPINLPSVGKWFAEKDLIITLSSNDAYVSPDQDRVRLVIVPSTEAPRITIASDVSSVTNSGDEATITFTASYAPQEDLTIYYKLSGDLADHFTKNAGSSATVIAAGATSADVVLTYTPTTPAPSSGDTLTVSADYERNTVKFTEKVWDADTETFSIDRDVHVDENMWSFSNDVVAAGYDQWAIKTADKPWYPGFPTPMFADGGTEIAGYPVNDDYTVVSVQSQTIGTPHTDPVTGNALKYQVPNNNVQSGIPYIRQGFNCEWAGSKTTAHKLKAWTRGAYRVVPMTGADVSKNVRYISLSQRVRTQDLNHYATFAWKNTSIGMNTSLTAGESKNGTTVPIFTASDGTQIWIWQLGRPTPEVQSLGLSGAWGVWYGAFEDDHGIGIYQIHNLNPNVDWEYQTGSGTVIRNETPGVDKGNHILYPTGIGEDLADVRTNNKGTLIHSVWTEMSDSTLTGAPADFWPGQGLRWTPRGGGVIQTGDTTTAAISLT